MGGICFCRSFPVPRTKSFKETPNYSAETRFFARFQTGHTPPKLPIKYRNLRHQRIIKQLPHMRGQDVRSRATIIILHIRPHYKEIFKISRKICVEFSRCFQVYFVRFLQKWHFGEKNKKISKKLSQNCFSGIIIIDSRVTNGQFPADKSRSSFVYY